MHLHQQVGFYPRERAWQTYCKGFAVSRITTSIILSVVMLSACGGHGQSRGVQPFIAPIYPAVQGLYESCGLYRGSFCFDRLNQMASVGFTLVVNYDQLYATAQQELAYAHQAHALGMKIIWDMSDPAFWNGTFLPSYYSQLAATCACSDNTGFVRYYINLIRKLPATWGYYVGDEVKSRDHTRMKAFADLVKQLDPNHPRLFISGEDAETMGAHLEPFVDTAEFNGGDIYPVGTSYPIASVGSISRAIQMIADRNGRQSVIVLQAFSWTEYPRDAPPMCSPYPHCARYPTEEEMREMRDLAMSNAHPQFLLWYSYYDIVRSGNAAGHWADLVKAIRTVPTTPTPVVAHLSRMARSRL